MPAFFVWLAAMLGPILATFIGRLIVALGIGAITFTGLDVLVTSLEDQFRTYYSGTGAYVVGILSLGRIDQAVLMLFSAYAARIGIKTVSGAVTRLVLKGT